MRALRKRVHARICAPSAVNAHRFGKDPLKRALYVILDRIPMRLTLPAGECGAIVRDDYL